MKYELISPAGNFASLKAAIDNGADAVYFGLKEFSMRAYAENFYLRDLKKVKEFCNEKKVKRYLTLNTIIFDKEIKKIEEILKKAKDFIDGVICWDFAVINLCRKYSIPFHISTQASVANVESAKFYRSLGAERIVVARELNLKQIKEISKIIDVEAFCHGAMCVSISGRCFTSQFLFNKSANRGECLQPCRRKYKIIDEDNNELVLENHRILSAKDLCTLPFIEKMKKAGIKCFKIEGRNRSPEYVAIVTKVYRTALDKKLSKKEMSALLNELKKVYNRGFSSGFYLGFPTFRDLSNSDSGEQTERKKYIGRVERYSSKNNIALVRIHNEGLTKNSEIYIIGKYSGVRRYKIERLEKNKEELEKVCKGDLVEIKVPYANKNDEVYLIEKKS
ncbi:MAG: peptidase U32 family protein [Candidatus Pacearchaeota archaeon]